MLIKRLLLQIKTRFYSLLILSILRMWLYIPVCNCHIKLKKYGLWNNPNIIFIWDDYILWLNSLDEKACSRTQMHIYTTTFIKIMMEELTSLITQRLGHKNLIRISNITFKVHINECMWW